MSERMINHRGTLMKMSDYMKLGCPDKIRRNLKGEYVTQPHNDYIDNIAFGTMAMMDPAGFQRRLHTDAKFREANMKWYEEEKARREREGVKQWMSDSSDSEVEVEVEPVDPEAMRLAEKRKKRNQMTRDRKKEKKRLMKEEQEKKADSS